MAAGARDLYVDLLIRTISNSIYEDPSMHPLQPAVYRPAHRRTGKDWPSVAHSMTGQARLRSLAALVQATIDAGVAGDYIEAGVWRGGSCILMRGLLAANGTADRKVYVADSFAGLPEPEPAYPADAGDNLHSHAELKVPLEEVRSNFARYGLLDDQVIFVKGFFKDALAELDAGPFALVRIDGDMYQSTSEALEHLYPKLSRNGYLVVDDYALPACRQAVDDYRQRHQIDDEIHRIDWTGIWWQRSR